jgi:hypothetical protein
MKKTIAILLVLCSVVTSAQQLTCKNAGTMFNSVNIKISPEEVRTLMAINTEALALYDAGRDKKIFGSMLLYGGIGLISANVIIAATTNNNAIAGSYNQRADATLAIIGGVMVVVAIPIKIGYSKKIKNSVELYNKSVTDNYKPAQKWTLLASNQQFGFRFEF